MPTRENAAILYERHEGRDGAVGIRDVAVGLDPLADHPELVRRRDELFVASNLSYDFIYEQVVCEDYQSLQDAISYITTLTSKLQLQLQ